MADKQAANGELSFIGHTTVIEGTIKPGFLLVATETGTALTGI